MQLRLFTGLILLAALTAVCLLHSQLVKPNNRAKQNVLQPNRDLFMHPWHVVHVTMAGELY